MALLSACNLVAGKMRTAKLKAMASSASAQRFREREGGRVDMTNLSRCSFALLLRPCVLITIVPQLH
jgi:hypothetical protein